MQKRNSTSSLFDPVYRLSLFSVLPVHHITQRAYHVSGAYAVRKQHWVEVLHFEATSIAFNIQTTLSLMTHIRSSLRPDHCAYHLGLTFDCQTDYKISVTRSLSKNKFHAVYHLVRIRMNRCLVFEVQIYYLTRHSNSVLSRSNWDLTII